MPDVPFQTLAKYGVLQLPKERVQANNVNDPPYGGPGKNDDQRECSNLLLQRQKYCQIAGGAVSLLSSGLIAPGMQNLEDQWISSTCENLRQKEWLRPQKEGPTLGRGWVYSNWTSSKHLELVDRPHP